jgi:hypothetical protein
MLVGGLARTLPTRVDSAARVGSGLSTGQTRDLFSQDFGKQEIAVVAKSYNSFFSQTSNM